MSKGRLNIVLAILLIFSALATFSAIRTDRYIRETQPRDQAQERCNTETIAVLTKWLELRAQRDGSMDVRDDAAVTADDASEKADDAADAILAKVIDGQPASHQELQTWRDAIAARRDATAARSAATAEDRRIRSEANEQRISLPKC